jgi:hypothetical protein
MIKTINCLFNFEEFVINKALFEQSVNNMYSKKWTVYWVLIFGIWSLFVSVWFEFDQIVQDRPNIAVT